MPFMPFQVLGLCLRALLALVWIGLDSYLIYEWNQLPLRKRVYEPIVVESSRESGTATTEPVHRNRDTESPWLRARLEFGFNKATALISGGTALLLRSAGGGWFTTRLRRSDPQSAPQRRNRVTEYLEIGRNRAAL